MVEVYDAATNSGVFQAYTMLLVLVIVGAVIEVVALPLLRRFVTKREWFLAEVLLRAISGQAIFWLSFIGLISSLALVVPNVRLAGVVRSLLALLAVLAATTFLVRLLTSAIRLYFLRHSIGSITLLNSVLRGFTATVLITTSLAVLGLPIGPLLTILAGSSIGLSLAVREPLANLFSGLTILASHKVQPGDYIRLSTGQEGVVTDIRWSDTSIRELADNVIVVPNAVMTSTILTNFHRPEPELLVVFPLGVPYTSDLVAVERLVLTVAEEVLALDVGGVPGAPPRVRLSAFSETSIQMNVLLRAKSFADQFPLRHEFMKRLYGRFEAEGLPLPIPAQAIRVTDGPLPPMQQQQYDGDRNGAGPPAA